MFLASTDGATALALRLVGMGQRSVTLAVEVRAPHARLALPDIVFFRAALRAFCDEAERLRGGVADAAALLSAQPGELELRLSLPPEPGCGTLGAELTLRRGRWGAGTRERFSAVFAVTPEALQAFSAGLRATLHERIRDVRL